LLKCASYHLKQSRVPHTFLCLVMKGYCPSDLAGMEGYEAFARWLALAETELVLRIDDTDDFSSFPKWLIDPIDHLEISTRVSGEEQFTWERYGGLRRMRSKLAQQFQS
jgi:hypothetical protein